MSYKKGHFETQHVARNTAINTVSLTVAGDDFLENSHQTITSVHRCEKWIKVFKMTTLSNRVLYTVNLLLKQSHML